MRVRNEISQALQLQINWEDLGEQREDCTSSNSSPHPKRVPHSSPLPRIGGRGQGEGTFLGAILQRLGKVLDKSLTEFKYDVSVVFS
jgi:hypothetical protein